MDSKLNLDSSAKTSWQHAALILSKKIQYGSKKANEELKSLLKEFKTIGNIYESHFSFIPVDEGVAKKLDDVYSKMGFTINCLTINEDDYPDGLRCVTGTPPIIYYRGDRDILKLKKSIAFVGTRELDNPKHIKESKNAIERLFKAGYEVIVSGLAKGSDSLGHQTAIELGGKTIAVLGTPLDKYYPSENRFLQEKIAESYLLLSEYPVGVSTQGSSFANRNLTTVSLSNYGVIVARAGDKSGTQYAIKACVEQNKPLYILENNIFESEYSWVSKYKKHLKVIR